MQIRRNILPRSLSDAFVTLFILTIIPIVYYFELFIVLPSYYPQWGPGYMFHFLSGTFILFNVCSNYVAIILFDTSIKGKMLPTTLTSNSRFCSVCECIAPPRSWHCSTCDVCILKRDHHCMFTSCCIGHYNLRYFYIFVFYIFLATIYASYYNVFFVYEFTDFGSWESIIKVIFPLATLFMSYSRNHVYLFLVMIILIGGIFAGVLFYYHGDLIMRGVITHERNQKMSPYDLGTKKNIIVALGEKWYLVWLCPFIESKLPSDGINWDVKQSIKAK